MGSGLNRVEFWRSDKDNVLPVSFQAPDGSTGAMSHPNQVSDDVRRYVIKVDVPEDVQALPWMVIDGEKTEGVGTAPIVVIRAVERARELLQIRKTRENGR